MRHMKIRYWISNDKNLSLSLTRALSTLLGKQQYARVINVTSESVGRSVGLLVKSID